MGLTQPKKSFGYMLYGSNTPKPNNLTSGLYNHFKPYLGS